MERYYKGASSAGAGVGLSLVKRICDRYGWRISLESMEGQGTTARIDFSERRADSRAPARETELPSRTPADVA
jgi:signal transduction histidine kinase